VKCKGRESQALGVKGSQKWLQRLVEYHPSRLTDAVRTAAGRGTDWSVEWVSPKAHDDWAEYRDGEFLRKLGLPHLVEALQTFWPECGPRWDGLGRATRDDGVVLIEAKSHLGELTSRRGAGNDSLELITSSPRWAKDRFGALEPADWHKPYYQYANRLADLEFLREHRVDAILAFVYFCDDHTMPQPASAEMWKKQLPRTYIHLGVQQDLSSRNVVNVYLPVVDL
jgi:hypothetical protein